MSKKYPPGVLSRSTPKLAHSAVAPLEGKLQLDRVGKRHSIFTNFSKMTISRA